MAKNYKINSISQANNNAQDIVIDSLYSKTNSNSKAKSQSLKNKLSFTRVKLGTVINPYQEKQVLVKLRNVNVQFGHTKFATKAMQDVSFNIYQGEVLGLVGESGSGKSTTGNAIMGLLNRRSGTIKVDNMHIHSRTNAMKSSFRKKFALKAQMIFQDPTNSLNPQKNIKKIIAEGLNNVDVVAIFAKGFDITTVSKLSMIVKGKKLPEYLKNLSVQYLLKLINDNKLNLLYDAIYIQAIKELETSGDDALSEGLTYLKLRKHERDHYFKNKRFTKKRIKEHLINDVIEAVGLSKQVLNRFPLEFSGGQQQRISISRSVITRPNLIIADEPISALDVSIQAQVVNIFNELKKKIGLTILFIAHDLRMIEYISDRIAVMYRGRIIEIGTHSEIIKNPIHPYTKSLLAAVPSINKIKTKLSTIKYDNKMHKYDNKNRPGWYGTKDNHHFVYGSEYEVKSWTS